MKLIDGKILSKNRGYKKDEVEVKDEKNKYGQPK
jgi:hypothetical protein